MESVVAGRRIPSTVAVDRISLGAAVRAELLGRVRISQAIIVLIAITVWELTARRVGSFFLPTPLQVVDAARVEVASGQLTQAVEESMKTLFIGYGAAIGVGVVLGFAMGWYRWIGRVLDPFVNGLYVIPTTALVPLIIIWFGLGSTARIVSIFLFAVFQILVSTLTGVRNRDEVLVEVARSFGARQLPLLGRVVFFDSLPHIFAGLRLGASQAIKGMVVAEFLFAATGIGGAIIGAADHYQTSTMFVYIAVTVALGVVLAGAVQALERILIKGR